jgi:hypothetical protein
MRIMKRAGLGVLVVILIVLIFSIEGILAVFRQRNLSVTVELRDAQGIVATMAATGEPTITTTSAAGTPQAIASLGSLPTDGALVVNINWNYLIGPRFPQTTVSAEVTDNIGVVVAWDTYVFQCGTGNSLECKGSSTLPLEFGVKNKQGIRTNWPAGSYTLQVRRAYADLKSTTVLTQTFTVTAP